MTAIETLTGFMAGLAHLIVTLILSIGVGAVAILVIRRLFLIDYLNKLDKKQLAYGHEKIVLQVVEWGVMAISFTYFADVWTGAAVAACGVSYLILQRSVFPWLEPVVPEKGRLLWAKGLLLAAVMFIIFDLRGGCFVSLFTLIFLIGAAVVVVPDQNKESEQKP